jgi:hypothetical protein
MALQKLIKVHSEHCFENISESKSWNELVSSQEIKFKIFSANIYQNFKIWVEIDR